MITSLLILLIFCLFINFNAWSVQTYHQWGIFPSSADAQQFNGKVQGVATQILVNSTQQVKNGGVHFFWVSAFIKESGNPNNVFAHMGYIYPCTGCTAYPFVATPNTIVPGSNIFIVYENLPLQNGWYTFWFGYSGVQNPNGTYKWYFNLIGPGYTNGPTFQFLNFAGRYADLYTVMAEVAGSSNPCADVVNVPFGDGTSNNYAYLAQMNGSWHFISHATSYYYRANCINANGLGSEIRSISFQRFRAFLPNTTRTTCANYVCTNGCEGSSECWYCRGCQVW